MPLYIVKEYVTLENGQEIVSDFYFLEHEKEISKTDFNELERKYRYSDYPHKTPQSAYQIAVDLEVSEGFKLLPVIDIYKNQ